MVGHGSADACRGRDELRRRPERIAIAADEQRRRPNPGEMFHSKPIWPPGRVQWVTDQDESGEGDWLCRQHRAHAAAHRAATDHDATGPDPEFRAEVVKLSSNCLDQHGSSIRRPTPSETVGKVHPMHRQRIEPFLQSDEAGMVAIRAGSRRQQQAGDATGPGDGHAPRRMRLASPSAAIRSAASSVSPPWSGCASMS